MLSVSDPSDQKKYLQSRLFHNLATETVKDRQNSSLRAQSYQKPGACQETIWVCSADGKKEADVSQ